MKTTHCTYQMMPSVIAGSILIGLPSSSRGGVMSKTCSNDAVLMKSEASAK